MTDNPKFYLSTKDRTGGCEVVGDGHSSEVVVFRTPHGLNNYCICTKCLADAVVEQIRELDRLAFGHRNKAEQFANEAGQCAGRADSAARNAEMVLDEIQKIRGDLR